MARFSLKLSGIRNTRGNVNRQLTKIMQGSAADTRRIAFEETHKDTGRLSRAWRIQTVNSAQFTISNSTPYGPIEFEYHPEQIEIIERKASRAITRRLNKRRKV